MAHTVQITKTQDGQSTSLFHIYLESDGVSPELTNFVVIDPSTFAVPPSSEVDSLKIEQAWYELSGMTIRLKFGASVPSNEFNIWGLTPGVSSYHDWRPFGGIQDRTNPNTSNGTVVIYTRGLVTSGSFATIVLKVRKAK
jgi:hypothetical protein